VLEPSPLLSPLSSPLLLLSPLSSLPLQYIHQDPIGHFKRDHYGFRVRRDVFEPFVEIRYPPFIAAGKKN
jgi:hypothetical protein